MSKSRVRGMKTSNIAHNVGVAKEWLRRQREEEARRIKRDAPDLKRAKRLGASGG